MFFPVDADWANVGTRLFFLDAIAAPRRGRCARRDLGNGNFCSHPRRTNKSDRNNLPVRGQNVLHDTNCVSGYRWRPSRFKATQRDLNLDHDFFYLSIPVREWRNAGRL